MRKARHFLWTLAVGSAVALGASCSTESARTTIVLATTTSVYDAGLLQRLLPPFESSTAVDVKVIAVGTGQALELGRRGDADVLITHAPKAESLFVARGYGERRLPFMRNQFVVVGPPGDPAGIAGSPTVVDAFTRIATSRSSFVSRADGSGTHLKEKEVWRRASLRPSGDWYVRCGAGMAQTLRVASELGAYTLTDRGTFLANRRHLRLQELFRGDPLLHNVYSVILVRHENPREPRAQAAEALARFLLSDEAKSIIATFREKQTGQLLFEPLSVEPHGAGTASAED